MEEIMTGNLCQKSVKIIHKNPVNPDSLIIADMAQPSNRGGRYVLTFTDEVIGQLSSGGVEIILNAREGEILTITGIFGGNQEITKITKVIKSA